MASRRAGSWEPKIREVFSLFEVEGSGQIKRTQLGDAVRALGLNPTSGELRAMAQEMDEDGSGVISFHEFLAVAVRWLDLDQANSYNKAAELREALRVLGSAGDGGLDLDDLRT